MHDKIKIDLETGLMIDVVSPYEFGEDIIETPCPDGLYLQRWDGTKWIEGLTQAEIDSIKNVIVEPTEAERLRALEDVMLSMILGGTL